MIRKQYKEKIRLNNGMDISFIDCPICDGKGIVRDKKKGEDRPCVGCKGYGKITD
jgi:hypothetical protein